MEQHTMHLEIWNSARLLNKVLFLCKDNCQWRYVTERKSSYSDSHILILSLKSYPMLYKPFQTFCASKPLAAPNVPRRQAQFKSDRQQTSVDTAPPNISFPRASTQRQRRQLPHQFSSWNSIPRLLRRRLSLEHWNNRNIPSLAKTHEVAICAIVTPFFFATSSTRLTISFPNASNSLEWTIPWTKPSEDLVVSCSRLLARIPPASGHHGMQLLSV